MKKHSLAMTEDEIIESVINARSFKAKRKIRRARMNDAFKISNTKMATILPYEPYNGPTSGRNSFVKTEMTEDEILESVLNPDKHKHSKRDIRKLDPSCVSDEVKEFWKQKVKDSELRRGRCYQTD